MEIGTYKGEVKDFESFIEYINTLAVIISEMFGQNCEVVQAVRRKNMQNIAMI